MVPSGIVIGATPDGSGWLDGLLATVETDYPVRVCETWDFELSAIAAGARWATEFVLLPYSSEVKDNALWDIVFKQLEGVSVSLSQTPMAFGMYLGKYRADQVERVGCPKVTDKVQAVVQEGLWTVRYAAAGPYRALGDLADTERFVEREGRTNMVVENQWLRRFKSCWDAPSMRASAERCARAREAVPC